MSTATATATLTLENLHELSEDLADSFGAHLAAAVADCRQNVLDNAAREVTLKLLIKPNENNPLEVIIQPVTACKTPARKLETVMAKTTNKNQLELDFGAEE